MSAWAMEHPFLAFFLAWVALGVLNNLLQPPRCKRRFR